MGYNSFDRLPSISTYSEAEKILSNAKPLRKTKDTADEPTIYPLGERRYARKFSIRRVGDEASRPKRRYSTDPYTPAPGAQADDIEVLLHGTPVITFHKPQHTHDGEKKPQEITIYGGSWHWSPADCAFLASVLYRAHAAVYTKRGMLVIDNRAGDTSKHIIAVKENGYVRATIDPTRYPGQPRLMQMEGNHTTVEEVLRLNRAETNNVRREHGQFYRYLKGILSVRSQTTFDGYEGEAVTRMYVPLDEMISTVPPECIQSDLMNPRIHITWGHVTPIKVKPAKVSTSSVYNDQTSRWEKVTSTEPYERWLAATADYIRLIATPDTDPAQSDNFYLAFRILLREYLHDAHIWSLSTGRPMPVNPQSIRDFADEILFKYFSERVIESAPRSPDRIPNPKYQTWVTRERD
jgi:hypothetical protein